MRVCSILKVILNNLAVNRIFARGMWSVNRCATKGIYLILVDFSVNITVSVCVCPFEGLCSGLYKGLWALAAPWCQPAERLL